MLHPDALLQNRYRIVRQLGKGGMGTVYEAVDQRLSSIVAIKETLSTTDEARRAFEREASLLANLRHRSLPNVTDYFAEGDGQFLVMQFIPGDDLAQLLELRQQPFPVAQVLFWADEILKALEYLHSHTPPILHRDIKPANLKLTREGELFLIDFGLSKGVAGQMPTLLTSRSVKGYTPAYSPLEQIHGGGTDPRSDLYSVAATMYHLLTNVPPVDAPTRFNALDELQPDPLQPADQVNLRVPPALAQILSQAMAMNRRNRPGGAVAMRQMLRQVLPATEQATVNLGKEVPPVILPTQPAPTTSPLQPQQQTEPLQDEAASASSGAQQTIKEVPSLIERPARLPSTQVVTSDSIAFAKRSHPRVIIAVISIVVIIGLGIGAAFLFPWLARRRATQNQTAQTTNPDTIAQQALVKPAAGPTKPNFSGDFNIGKALELAYGGYDYNKKYVKWKLTNEDAKNAPKDAQLPSPGVVYAAPTLVRSFVENGMQRYLVLTESVPPHYDCHACAPIIGGATFSQRGTTWELDTFTKIIASLGSFGRPPSSKLIPIGSQKYAAELRGGYTAQGETMEGVTLIAEVDDTLREIFSDTTGGDNSGDCGEGSMLGTPCWKFSSKIDFEPGANADYFDIKVTTSGTKEDDNGKVVRANGVRKYTFTKSQYTLAK